jgi:hypothetical protein
MLLAPEESRSFYICILNQNGYLFAKTSVDQNVEY